MNSSGQMWKVMLVVLTLVSACWSQKVIMPSQVPCTQEEVKPNLDLSTRTHLVGQLKDATGAPFSKSKVELRRQSPKGSFRLHRAVTTDISGAFDLGEVETGKYRFLPAPNRGFKQPDYIDCSGNSHCELKLVLEVNPTDKLYAGCPIQ